MSKDRSKQRDGADTHAKDANDALRMGLDLKKMLSRANAIPHKQILTFTEVREQVIISFFQGPIIS